MKAKNMAVSKQTNNAGFYLVVVLDITEGSRYFPEAIDVEIDGIHLSF